MAEVKNYKEFTEEDLRSKISLRQDEKKVSKLMIDYNHGKQNNGLYVEGSPIKFVRKNGPGSFMFKLDGTDKENKHFKSYVRHLIYILSKKMTPLFKDLYEKSKSRKNIALMMNRIIDKDGAMCIRLRETLYTKNRSDINSQIKELCTKIVEVISGKSIRKHGVNFKNFIKYYRAGTKFVPIYLFDSLKCSKNTIKITVALYELRKVNHEIVNKKRRVFNYSDSEEDDSDHDYLNSDDEKEIEQDPVKEDTEEYNSDADSDDGYDGSEFME